LVRGDLVRPPTGYSVDDFGRGFDNAALADFIHPTLDTNQLGGAGQGNLFG
jgi:hypothetical protein